MIFKSVSLKNFYKYGINEQTLDLDKNGIRLVTADNGEGKSSIFYAIVWCLYGKTLQDTVDDVVNRRTKKNCKVSVEFIEDGFLYKIIRYRKHEEHENNIYVFKGENDISMRKSADTQQLILDIVKMPYQAFINSTFFSTELYKEFLRAKTSERLTVFENLLSLKEVTMFYDSAKTFHTNIKEHLEELKIQKAVKISEKETTEKVIKDYVETAKRNILNLKEQKSKLQEEYSNKEKAIQEYSNINIEEELKNIDNGKRVESLKVRLENKTSELEATALVDYIDKDEEYVKRFENIDFKEELKKEKKIAEIKNEIDKLEKSIIEIDSRINIHNKELAIAENELNSVEKELECINKELASLSESTCLHCGQKVNSKFVEEKTNEFTEKKNSLEASILTNKVTVEILNDRIKTLKSEKALKDYQIKRFELPVLFEGLESGVASVIQNIEMSKERISTRKKEEEKTKERNAKIQKEIEEIEKEIGVFNYVPKYTEEFILHIKETLAILESDLSIIKNKISEIDGKASSMYDKKYVDSNKLKIAMLEQDIISLEFQENSSREDDKYFLCLMECFSNREESFKKFFIGTMIDSFNEKINNYLPFFFEENLKITFDKELADTIEMDGDVITFNSLSTGQKAKAEISVAFALFDLSRIFFSSETNLLIIDEMLDKGIDQRGVESALSIVEGMASDIGIFIVSHKTDLKDSIKNKIEIKRDENNFSVIK